MRSSPARGVWERCRGGGLGGCALVFLLLPPTLLSSLSPFLCFLPLPSSHFSFPSLSSFSTHFLCPLLLPSPLPPSSILKSITIGFSSASGHKQRPCGPVFVKTSSSEWFLHILKVWGKTSKPKTTKTKTYPKQSRLCSRDNDPQNLKYLLRAFAEKVCRALKYVIRIGFTCFFLLLLGVAAGKCFTASCCKLHCIPPGRNHSL